MLAYLKDHIEYLSLHTYVGNRGERLLRVPRLFQSAGRSDPRRRRESFAPLRAAAPGKAQIYIAFDEWNVWYRARGQTQRGRRILEEHYNLEDALVVATMLNTFVNNADTVKIANMAQIVNVIAPIFTNGRACSCRRFTIRFSCSRRIRAAWRSRPTSIARHTKASVTGKRPDLDVSSPQ